MDFELKLQALARLSDSPSEAAKSALKDELDATIEALRTSQDVDNLQQQLRTLEAIAHLNSTQIVSELTDFLRNISTRKLAGEPNSRYSSLAAEESSQLLILSAIAVLERLRYLETVQVVSIVLDLAIHPNDRIRAKALEAVKSCAEYNLEIFRSIGADPQIEIISAVEAYDNTKLRLYFRPILVICECLVSTTMESVTSTYKTVTISKASTPAQTDVAEARNRAIAVLKRIFSLSESEGERVSVLSRMVSATRTMGQGPPSLASLISRDSISILTFFEQLIPISTLTLIQKIEHHSYWIHYHAAGTDVQVAALRVRDAINRHVEYQTFKVLIGFEGIFNDWTSTSDTSAAILEADSTRERQAKAFAESITENNYAEWRDRIIEYSRVQSDDLATFPVFHKFLYFFAAENPALALRLLRECGAELKAFLVPLLRGMLDSDRTSTLTLFKQWIQQGINLQAIARTFIGNETPDVDTLTEILREAVDKKDIGALFSLITKAIDQFTLSGQLLAEEIFLPAIRYLTTIGETRWIYDVWYMRKSAQFYEALGSVRVQEVLENLLHLQRIDHQAEEVLYQIATRQPSLVLDYLFKRLELDGKSYSLDAIPFDFHKLPKAYLNKTSETVKRLRSVYRSDMTAFEFREGRLLSNLYPDFPSSLADALIEMARQGNNEDLSFIAAVLWTYEGELAIYGVAKEVIKHATVDSRVRQSIRSALMKTSVMVGEFGVALAYEAKAKQIEPWLEDDDPNVQEFARGFRAEMERISVEERRRADESIAIRKLQYGE